jgi:hypothetical protein
VPNRRLTDAEIASGLVTTSTNSSSLYISQGSLNMTTRDLYGLVIRLGGAVLWFVAAYDGGYALAVLFGMPLPPKYTAGTTGTVAGVFFVLGLLMTYSADFLTRVAYGRKPS